MQILISGKPSRMSRLGQPPMPWMFDVRTVCRTSDGIEACSQQQPIRRRRRTPCPWCRASCRPRWTARVENGPAPTRSTTDAEHVADRVRAEAGADCSLRRHGVRRRDVRIKFVVDVEQRALRALEQDAIAGTALLVEQRPHRVHIRQHLRRDGGQLVVDRARLDLAHAHAAPQRVVMRQQPLDLAVEHLQVGEVHQPDARSVRLPGCPRKPGRCPGRWCRSHPCRMPSRARRRAPGAATGSAACSRRCANYRW